SPSTILLVLSPFSAPCISQPNCLFLQAGGDLAIVVSHGQLRIFFVFFAPVSETVTVPWHLWLKRRQTEFFPSMLRRFHKCFRRQCDRRIGPFAGGVTHDRRTAGRLRKARPGLARG